ncbi:hypothetical protein [Glutamicibacter sp.]|uniref:hypothetical protein n=1 Tax=Glutamicibacter sp. TaxID=1931995 RepID=UPI0028BF42B0|nr:hypothetical protein [Glutamicibacter sp.]
MANSRSTPQLHSLVASAQRAIAEASYRRTFDLPYAAPDRRANPEVESTDKLRAGLFILAAALLLLTSLSVSTSRQTAAGLLDVGLVQWLIWPLISIALLLSACFSALSHQLSSRRQRAVSIYTLSSTALMACALTLASGFLGWAAAVVATLSLVLSLNGVRTLNQFTARNHLERLATDMPLSFFAGFSLVYTLQLWFAAAGFNGGGHSLFVTLLSVGIAGIAVVLAHSERGRHAFASGFGVAMIAAAVQGWKSESTPLWVCAIWAFLAVVVFICAENRRFQISHAEHRALAGKELDF